MDEHVCLVVDMYKEDLSDQDWNDILKKLFESFCSEKTEKVIFLIKEGCKIDPQQLLESRTSNALELLTVSHPSKLGGLHEVKGILDKNNINTPLILISVRCMPWWFMAVKLIFTPLYTVNFQILRELRAILEDIVEEMEDDTRELYQSLPAIGPAEVLTSSKIQADMFVHGFSTRYGGLSSYPGMQSMNLVYSDKKRDSKMLVQENARRLALHSGFDGDKLKVAAACHGISVWVVGEDRPNGHDAIITNTSGEVVAAPGADCLILIFADPVKKCCGAAHAGWRGTITQGGVAMATVMTMVEKFGSNPCDVMVAFGPAIGPCCCEFGEDDAQNFFAIDPRCVVRKPDHHKPFVDVPLANRLQLERGGILPENIDLQQSFCTKCHPEKVFSFRRDGFPFGNHVGFIGLK